MLWSRRWYTPIVVSSIVKHEHNITSNPYNPIATHSAAMTYIKLKKWANAEQDATSALNIDPRHFKSHQRRAVARLSLGKLRAALIDACAAEDCVEDDKSLKEIRQLQQKIEIFLLEAVERAPRRKVNVEITES
jgi:hypothetical protein